MMAAEQPGNDLEMEQLEPQPVLSIRATVQIMEAWLKEHGRKPDGVPWEVYYWIDPKQYRGASTWPDSSSWRTQLIQPIK